MSRQAGTLITSPDITPEELQLAVRNHSMPLEALRYDVTPLGLHYLLIHFDIPPLDACTHSLNVGGSVHNSLTPSLDDVMTRPATTLAVTLECADNDWNFEGVENNAVQRVRVVVGRPELRQPPADSL